MARKFLDGMRTRSPRSRTLATPCGLPRMHRKLGDTLDAIPTDWWSLCSTDWGKGGKPAFTGMRKGRSRMVRCACRAGQEPLMWRGPMRKEWAACSSLPAIPRYHDPQTSFPQRAWKSRAGMWGERVWRSIASVDLLCWFLRPRPTSWSTARRRARRDDDVGIGVHVEHSPGRVDRPIQRQCRQPATALGSLPISDKPPLCRQ